MSDFNLQVQDKFERMGIRLTPCRYCGEKVVFLATNTPSRKDQKKVLVIAVDLSLESHFRKCKQKQEPPSSWERENLAL